jgi:hypothetical protein
MRENHKLRKNKFLAFCLSVMMVSSAAAIASCGKSTSTTSDSTTDTETESTLSDSSLLIKNGGFETFNTNKGLNAIGTSVNGWSYSKNSASSGSANTSQAASGIINLEESAWDKLTGENSEYNVETLTVEEAEALHRGTEKALMLGVENPDMTLGEIMDKM